MDRKETYIEELEKENKLLREQNKLLTDTVSKLTLRITDLERRLGLDSSTSSKPPSSDGLRKKPTPKSLRSKSGKKSGGQKGHKGHTLSQVDHPDEVIEHNLSHCSSCQNSLGSSTISHWIKRQVFDIPEPCMQITEHLVGVKVCSCGQQVRAPFPEGVRASAQYGPRIKAVAGYLHHQQLIPEDRLVDVFKDIFQVPITSGTLVSMGKSLEKELSDWMDMVRQTLQTAPVKHLDETGFRIGGKTSWLHTQSTPQETYYRPTLKRGDVPTDLEGVVIHDHFKPYFKQLSKAAHTLCNAHHLRELKALVEIEKEAWASKMSSLLRFASHSSDPPVDRITRLYDQIVEVGLRFHEAQPALATGKRGRKKRRVGHNLLIRLRDFKTETLRFLTEEDVPFTNNLAEQDIRMMKVKQKISGGFRTMEGAQTFCTLRSFFSTCRKRGVNIFSAITQTLQTQNPLMA